MKDHLVELTSSVISSSLIWAVDNWKPHSKLEEFFPWFTVESPLIFTIRCSITV